MNAEQLKALQAPIKAKYKDNPGAAVVTLHAQATCSSKRWSPALA